MQYIYEEDKKSALERLVQQATFKFRALWCVTDGKGLMYTSSPWTTQDSTYAKQTLHINLHKQIYVTHTVKVGGQKTTYKADYILWKLPSLPAFYSYLL